MKKLILILATLALALSAQIQAAEVTISVPDNQAQRVLDAIAALHGYTGTAPGGGAETKAQFARRMLARWCAQQVKEYEGALAAKNARTTAETSVDSIGIQ